ncbi:hypothetical protein KVR01_012865 [Diaporthe batatas]|uniref:uncharacterized protein n=1 Tax=Diaporthe batatas TaxID=748121 RepID=UPI001D0400F1|nr:uncharacterized protein KVR01_012865 [Diaporthe batatas]KAG8157157.1 hypothetical protein KVR01_012865 [Diaporthe batatas]
MSHKHKKPAKPSVANGGRHRCPDCRKIPIASCFGHHLFMCKSHPSICYTKFNPCQLCEGESRRRARAEKIQAAEAKAELERRKAQQKEEARQKLDRKLKWTDSQRAARLTAMGEKSG